MRTMVFKVNGLRVALLALALCIVLPSVQLLTLQTAGAARVGNVYGGTKTLGGTGSDTADTVTTDKNGNTYMSGSFTGTVDFNPGGTADNITGPSGFLTKYNADGSYAWTKKTPIAADYIATDSLGNLYLTGSFYSTTDFNIGGTPDVINVAGFTSTVYLTKYNANGTYGWTKAFDSVNVKGLAVDTNNIIYLGGRFTGTVDFDPSGAVDSKVSNGSDDIYITKYNASGTYISTKTIGGINSERLGSLAVDSSNNLFITGTFQATVDFNPGGAPDSIVTAASTSYVDVFLTRYNANGTYGWTKTVNATTVQPQSMTVNSSGQVYVVGYFYQTTDFNSGGGGDIIVPASGNDETYLSKYNTDGSYAWTRRIGASGDDYFYGLVIDAQGNVYTGGTIGTYSASTVIFNKDNPSNTKPIFGNAPAIVGFKSDGSYLMDVFINNGGVEKYAYAYGITLGTDGYVRLVGKFQTTSDFDIGAATDTKTSNGNYDVFLTSYKPAFYYNIAGLPSGIKITTLDGTSDAADTVSGGILSSSTAMVRLSTSADVPLADIRADMTVDRSWATLTAASDATAGKSVVHNLTSQPGAASSFTLYVPKVGTHTAVYVCPGAATLADVTATCAGGVTKTIAAQQITEVTIGGKVYFAVPGLSGTGAMSIASTLVNTGRSQYMILAGSIGLTVLGGYTIRRRQRII